jgi:hypothetical protein
VLCSTCCTASVQPGHAHAGRAPPVQPLQDRGKHMQCACLHACAGVLWRWQRGRFQTLCMCMCAVAPDSQAQARRWRRTVRVTVSCCMVCVSPCPQRPMLGLHPAVVVRAPCACPIPTCLICTRSWAQALATPEGCWHVSKCDPAAALSDGTPNYLGAAALKLAYDAWDSRGGMQVRCKLLACLGCSISRAPDGSSLAYCTCVRT